MVRSMTWIGFLAAIFVLAFAVEAFAEDDSDGDGIPDAEDNCPEVSNADQSDLDGDGPGDVCDNCLWAVNTNQDDCDDDHCGNLCDCDYNQDGVCGIFDFGAFVLAFGSTDDLCRDHTEPVTGRVGLGDFGFFVANFGQTPGPSGTTPGTVACPIWEPGPF